MKAVSMKAVNLSGLLAHATLVRKHVTAAHAEMDDAVSLLRDMLEVEEKKESAELRSLREVAGWAQAVLTALNCGDVAKDSKLHHQLRDVMIAHRRLIESNPA